MRSPTMLMACLVLAACREPPPEPAPLPEPQAQATELREAIQAPLDKARAVEATQAADETERQQALKDASG